MNCKGYKKECEIELKGRNKLCPDCKKSHRADYDKEIYRKKDDLRIKEPVALLPDKQFGMGIFIA